MSIHVCRCLHNGQVEYHLRYPGLSEKQAQAIASKINSGWLDRAEPRPHEAKESNPQVQPPPTDAEATASRSGVGCDGLLGADGRSEKQPCA